MHPLVFFPALLTAGGLAFSFSVMAIDRLGAMSIGVALLLWTAVIALAWTRWVRKPARWLARVATAVGLLMLTATVYAWAQQTDVFVDYRANCPPRTGTFWKLVGAWVGGAAAINFSMFGRVIMRRTRDLRSARRLMWLGSILLWSGACAFVFVRNINAEVALRSLKVVGSGLGGLLIFVAFVVVLAAVIWLVGIPSRKRHEQAQADYLAIDEDRKHAIRAIVDRHARGTEHCLYYREIGASGWDIRRAHIGGGALMPAHESWPVDDEREPALFLLQLPMPEVLPSPWPGRVLGLWLSTSGFDVQVRSYAAADDLIEVLQPLSRASQFSPVQKGNLSPLALPLPHAVDDEAQGDEFCNLLIQDCAELMAALEALTSQPAAVLPMILQDDRSTRYLEPGLGVWVGGEPQLIQNPHEARCEICARTMRFLFSSGDVTEEMAFGDVGVVYVYGCDEHPQHCQAFVDCH